MACKTCGGRPRAVVDPRRGSRGSWCVIYPNAAVRPFRSEKEARAFMATRSNPDSYALIDPDLNPVPYPS